MIDQLRVALILMVFVSSPRVLAQSLPPASSSPSEVEAEDIYDRDEAKTEHTKAAEHQQAVEVKAHEKKPEVNATTLSDLAKLSSFSDVAVIQKKYLPKTDRFEVSASGYTNLNNPFYTNYGLGLELSYYFTEKWALELLGQVQSTGARQVTDDLKSGPKIATDNLVTSKGFFGAGIKWNPIYGKITWLNKSIVPFDLNFNAGLGETMTTTDQTAMTLHLGTSQVFAYSKSMAFRWDLSWNIYQADTTDGSGVKSKVTQNDLYLGAGVSFYFPEVSYR